MIDHQLMIGLISVLKFLICNQIGKLEVTSSITLGQFRDDVVSKIELLRL